MLRSLDSGRSLISAADFIPDVERTVCITGHRPDNIIPYKGEEKYRAMTEKIVKLVLFRHIDALCEMGYDCFISGLAEGTDLWAAEHIIGLKQNGCDVSLAGVMPYLRHSRYFGSDYKNILAKVEKNCDDLILINQDPNAGFRKKGPGSTVYRDRNYFMVDNSSAVIAFYNLSEYRSGTGQTVRYAQKTGKKYFHFSMDDIYELIDGSGFDKQRIYDDIIGYPVLPESY